MCACVIDEFNFGKLLIMNGWTMPQGITQSLDCPSLMTASVCVIYVPVCEGDKWRILRTTPDLTEKQLLSYHIDSGHVNGIFQVQCKISSVHSIYDIMRITIKIILILSLLLSKKSQKYGLQ